jgi:hypothetical protein
VFQEKKILVCLPANNWNMYRFLTFGVATHRKGERPIAVIVWRKKLLVWIKQGCCVHQETQVLEVMKIWPQELMLGLLHWSSFPLFCVCRRKIRNKKRALTCLGEKNHSLLESQQWN